jgi:hypothetical protein
MWTYSSVHVPPAITVQTKHLKSFGIIIPTQPRIEVLSTLFPVLRPVVKNVIDRQKDRARLTTAFAARTAVSGECGRLLSLSLCCGSL